MPFKVKPGDRVIVESRYEGGSLGFDETTVIRVESDAVWVDGGAQPYRLTGDSFVVAGWMGVHRIVEKLPPRVEPVPEPPLMYTI